MQKITKYRLINLILTATMVIVYFVLQDKLKPFTFEIVVLYVAFCIFAKAILLNSDSNLWFSLVLFGICVIMTLDKLNIIKLQSMWPLILVYMATCSLIIAIIYKDYMQLNMTVLFLFTGIVSLVYSFKLIGLALYIVLLIVSVIVQIIVSAFVIDRIKRIK